MINQNRHYHLSLLSRCFSSRKWIDECTMLSTMVATVKMPPMIPTTFTNNWCHCAYSSTTRIVMGLVSYLRKKGFT